MGSLASWSQLCLLFSPSLLMESASISPSSLLSDLKNKLIVISIIDFTSLTWISTFLIIHPACTSQNESLRFHDLLFVQCFSKTKHLLFKLRAHGVHTGGLTEPFQHSLRRSFTLKSRHRRANCCCKDGSHYSDMSVLWFSEKKVPLLEVVSSLRLDHTRRGLFSHRLTSLKKLAHQSADCHTFILL